MGAPRTLTAVVLVALMLAGGVAAWEWTRPKAGDSGAFHVEVTGPDSSLFNGSLDVENATALALLQAAGAKAHFEVLTREYPGMGTYVYSIGGFTARDASGWVYEVRKNGKWIAGDRSAAYYPVHEGEDLRWRWVDSWSG